jgi:hypothetical protein
LPGFCLPIYSSIFLFRSFYTFSFALESVMVEHFSIAGPGECSLADAQKAEQLSRQKLGEVAFGNFSPVQLSLIEHQSNDLKGLMPHLLIVDDEKTMLSVSGFKPDVSLEAEQGPKSTVVPGRPEAKGVQVDQGDKAEVLSGSWSSASGESLRATEQHKDKAAANEFPELTVDQLLSLTPEVIPARLNLSIAQGANLNEELARLKQTYQDRYGETLGWAAEINGNKVLMSLLVSHGQTDEMEELDALTSTSSQMQSGTSRSGGEAGKDASALSEAQLKESMCINEKTREFDNQQLGLPADSDNIDMDERKDALTAKLDPNLSGDQLNAIGDARVYGLNESLSAEEIARHTNVAHRARWAEMLGLPADASFKDILQFQTAELMKVGEGLEGQALTDAQEALSNQWRARYVGLANSANVSEEVIESAYNDMMRRETIEELKLDPNSSWKDIQARNERLRMKLDLDTSDSEVERIKLARLHGLSDDTDAAELSKFEKQLEVQRAKYATDNCHINETSAKGKSQS